MRFCLNYSAQLYTDRLRTQRSMPRRRMVFLCARQSFIALKRASVPSVAWNRTTTVNHTRKVSIFGSSLWRVVVVVSRYDDRAHSITHSPTPIVGFFPSSLTLSRRRCIVGSVGESISLAIHHTRTLYYTYRGSLHLRKQRDRYRANWASHWASTLIREMMIFTRHHRPFLPLFI